MKKYTGVLMGISIIVLTGCSGSIQDRLASLKEAIMNESTLPQQQEEVVLTSSMVYEHLNESTSVLDLSNMGLIEVPDICTLLDKEDYTKVRHLNLSNNAIKVVDQDLSCLVFLKSLNLSYNEIENVVSLGTLNSLTDLKLQKNNLRTLAGLPEFPLLQKLNLGFNSLTDTLGLDKYTNLEVLELYHNEIETVIGLENLQKLEQLKVEFNNIKDFGFVEVLKDQGLEMMTAKGNEIKDSLLDELKNMNNEYIERLRQEYTIGSTGSAEILIENE